MKKLSLFILILSLLTNYLLAQCRIVRIETSDSTVTHYTYNQQGKVSAEKFISPERTEESRFQYDNNKLIGFQYWVNDTLVRTFQFVFTQNLLSHTFTTKGKANMPLEFSTQYYYNQKGQAIRCVRKIMDGDSIVNTYEYAPEGWVKRWTSISTDPNNSFRLDRYWDDNQKIVDDPMRLFFEGFPTTPGRYPLPIEPLSVKGNWKKSIWYKMDKDGNFIKDMEEEIFDVKANKRGLWTGNKYRNSDDNKVVTHEAFYEGCKD